MRTLKTSLPSYPQDTSINFPFGTIINQIQNGDVVTVEGTPVTREVLGDILTNAYKMLDITNVVPNNVEDSDATSYQLIEAFQRLPNALNDSKKFLGYSGNLWSIDLDFSILPNDYFCFVSSSRNYDRTLHTTIRDANGLTRSFTCATDFITGENLILFISSTAVFALSLESPLKLINEVFLSSIPLGYNESDKLYYLDNGVVKTDTPSAIYVEQLLRSSFESNIILSEVVLLRNRLLCLAFLPTTSTYKIYQILLSDVGTATETTLVGFTFPTGVDRSPFFFGEIINNTYNVYLTNDCGNDVLDNKICKLNYDFNTNTLTKVSTVEISTNYTKTTNTVIKNNLMYVLVNGALKRYDLSTGIETSLTIFSGGIAGQLFAFNKNIFYSTGEIAKRWSL